ALVRRKSTASEGRCFGPGERAPRVVDVHPEWRRPLAAPARRASTRTRAGPIASVRATRAFPPVLFGPRRARDLSVVMMIFDHVNASSGRRRPTAEPLDEPLGIVASDELGDEPLRLGG